MDVVELDVQICASGELVVIHDADVERTTDGSGKVSDLTLVELKELDAGGGERIPTLSEVTDLVSGRARVNIELKGRDTADPVNSFLEKLVRSGNWERPDLLVSSFNPGELLRFSEISEGFPFGFIVEGSLSHSLDFACELGAWSLNPRYDAVDEALISDCRGSGLKLITWTVNDPEEVRKLIVLGVDGIVSDTPEIIPRS